MTEQVGPPIELDITLQPPVIRADVGVQAPTYSHTDARGTVWWKGDGAPDNIPGSQIGDAYLDLTTGVVYWLAGDVYELGG